MRAEGDELVLGPRRRLGLLPRGLRVRGGLAVGVARGAELELALLLAQAVSDRGAEGARLALGDGERQRRAGQRWR